MYVGWQVVIFATQHDDNKKGIIDENKRYEGTINLRYQETVCALKLYTYLLGMCDLGELRVTHLGYLLGVCDIGQLRVTHLKWSKHLEKDIPSISLLLNFKDKVI